MIELRLIAERDLEFVRELRNQFADSFYDNHTVNAQEQREWFETITASDDVKFYIISKDGQRAGTISLTDRDEAIEIGNLMLHASFHGQGLMTEACRVLIQPGRKYIAHIKPDNERSRALFLRLGFTPTQLVVEKRNGAGRGIFA